MTKFTDVQILHNFAAIHASIHNHFNHDLLCGAKQTSFGIGGALSLLRTDGDTWGQLGVFA